MIFLNGDTQPALFCNSGMIITSEFSKIHFISDILMLWIDSKDISKLILYDISDIFRSTLNSVVVTSKTTV